MSQRTKRDLIVATTYLVLWAVGLLILHYVK